MKKYEEKGVGRELRGKGVSLKLWIRLISVLVHAGVIKYSLLAIWLSCNY